jgi:hypothetical protein
MRADALGGDDAAARELPTHRLRGAREHQLGSVRFRQLYSLAERKHRRSVHSGDAAEIQQHEAQRPPRQPYVDPIEQPARRPEEHEPLQPQDLDPIGERPQRRPLFGRPISEGAHPKAIQARVGHASIATILNLYGHPVPLARCRTRRPPRRRSR